MDTALAFAERAAEPRVGASDVEFVVGEREEMGSGYRLETVAETPELYRGEWLAWSVAGRTSLAAA